MCVGWVISFAGRRRVLRRVVRVPVCSWSWDVGLWSWGAGGLASPGYSETRPV